MEGINKTIILSIFLGGGRIIEILVFLRIGDVILKY
tara:strand:+ start:628 stop:735 length:108 start_codon:yes stop_codon:yes gene_type:complete